MKKPSIIPKNRYSVVSLFLFLMLMGIFIPQAGMTQNDIVIAPDTKISLPTTIPGSAIGWNSDINIPNFPDPNESYFSGNIVYVDMAAIDQPFWYNRLGVTQPTGMIYALQRDIVAKDGGAKAVGNVMLREDKRPRPCVLRCNAGDIMIIKFTNYLRPYKPKEDIAFINGLEGVPPTPEYKNTQSEVNSIYPATRAAGVHIMGTEMVNTILDDGSFAGAINPAW